MPLTMNKKNVQENKDPLKFFSLRNLSSLIQGEITAK